MATDDGVREVERGERLTGTPFGHWRGMRFGEGRRGGAVSGRSERVVLVGLPLLLCATAAVHLAFEPQWWGVWSMVLAPITVVAVVALWRVRRRKSTNRGPG